METALFPARTVHLQLNNIKPRWDELGDADRNVSVKMHDGSAEASDKRKGER